jgi:hypothetical protein
LRAVLKRLFPTLSRINPDVGPLEWAALLFGLVLFVAPMSYAARSFVEWLVRA